MYNLFFLIQDETLRNQLHILLIFTCIAIGLFLSTRCDIAEPEEAELQVYGKKISLYSLLLLLAIALGAAFRFYGITWGLPAQYHPDEFEEASYLHSMIANHTIMSNYYQQPPLILYLSWPVTFLLKFLEILNSNSLAQDVLAGRIINATAGVISIYLIFALGKRISSDFTGIIAAFLLAVIPLHVTNSRYMKQDVLLVTFVIACALAVIKSIDLKKPFYLYLAGIFGGLATCSKYSGAACAGIIMSAPWLQNYRINLFPNWKTLLHSILATLTMIFSFLLTMPYVLISKENFSDLVNGIKFESLHARTGHHGYSIDAWSQLWMFHFSRSLIPGIELLPVVAALICAGIFIRRLESKGIFLIAAVLFFYIPAELAHSKPPPQPDRYVLPCVPFMALLAGEFLQIIKPCVKKRTLISLTLVLLIFPLTRSTLLASELTYDTRAKMSDWLFDNLPPGSKIIKAGAAAYLPKIPQKLETASARDVLTKDKSDITDQLRKSEYDYIIITSFTQGRFTVQNIDPKNKQAIKVRDEMKQIRDNFLIVKQMAPQWGSYGFHNPTITLYSLHQ